MSVKGPLYGVELIDSLPLSNSPHGMTQAMPSRADLSQVAKHNARVSAGYEVLLRHYQLAMQEIKRLKESEAAQ